MNTAGIKAMTLQASPLHQGIICQSYPSYIKLRF